jgi:hypothetical protein
MRETTTTRGKMLAVVASLSLASSPLSEVAHNPGTAGAFCDATVKQYAGYFNLTTGDKHLF